LFYSTIDYFSLHSSKICRYAVFTFGQCDTCAAISHYIRLLLNNRL